MTVNGRMMWWEQHAVRRPAGDDAADVTCIHRGKKRLRDCMDRCLIGSCIGLHLDLPWGDAHRRHASSCCCVVAAPSLRAGQRMIGTTTTNMLQGLRRALAIALLTAGCSGDTAMSPAAGFTGVWRGHTPLGSPRDSILLVLVDSTNGVSASAVWRPDDGLGMLDLSGTGSRNGDRLALMLKDPQPFLGLE